jgi:hypothetical protein
MKSCLEKKKSRIKGNTEVREGKKEGICKER